MTKRIKISKWDKDLFNYLYTNKVSTLEQIVRDLPHYSSKSSYIWRLWKLKKLGYLTGQYNEEHDGTNIYRITKSTFQKYISRGSDLTTELGSDAVFHDLDLVDIRSKIIQSNKVKRYYTENMIQFWDDENYDKLVPYKSFNTDAVINVDISDDNFWFGLEYEASVKTKKRYHDLFSNYYLNNEIVAILYICKDESVRRSLERFELDIAKNRAKKIYYATLNSLTEENKLEFQSSDGIVIKL